MGISHSNPIRQKARLMCRTIATGLKTRKLSTIASDQINLVVANIISSYTTNNLPTDGDIVAVAKRLIDVGTALDAYMSIDSRCHPGVMYQNLFERSIYM